MQKDVKIAGIFTGVLVLLLVVTFSVKNVGADPGASSAGRVDQTNSTVSLENGVQVIDMTAKGGYSPSTIVATAGIATELRVTTTGTYDCSSSIAIPALGYQKFLPPTGTETIRLNAEQAEGILTGTCSMGMYRFEIAFQ